VFFLCLEIRSSEGGENLKQPKAPKYRNKKATVDNVSFDSKDESIYYLYLVEQKQNGLIRDFELQPQYELVPAFVYQGRKRKAITYTPDFKIIHNDGHIDVVDVKSMGSATQQGELRRKLFEFKYPDILLRWVCRNLKHGDEYGWIDYDELKKIYAKNKREKKVKP
jgi:hypothetical protein